MLEEVIFVLKSDETIFHKWSRLTNVLPLKFPNQKAQMKELSCSGICSVSICFKLAHVSSSCLPSFMFGLVVNIYLTTNQWSN
jgi:hypothetical protein